MTTYTLTNGLAVYYDPADGEEDTVLGLDDSNITLELVAPATTTSLSYTVNPLEPGDSPGEGNETVDITLDSYTIRIHGMTADISDVSIFEVEWTDDLDITQTSTVLVPVLDGITVGGLGTVDADYIFVIDGAPLPSFVSTTAWNEFNSESIDSISIPAGTYGPGVAIPLTSLGATVSQNDIITGTSGVDVFWGGVGEDAISGLGGNDKLHGDGGRDTMLGGAGHDKIWGGKAKDTLKGGAGNDTLWGNGGHDKMYGNNGDDTLIGGSGNDKMFGGKGRDTFDGGSGNDTMTGHAQADTFIFGTGADVVTDFNVANAFEKVDLSGVASITGATDTDKFNDLVAQHLSEVGGNVVIDDLAGNTMTLNGVTIASLSQDEFIF